MFEKAYWPSWLIGPENFDRPSQLTELKSKKKKKKKKKTLNKQHWEVGKRKHLPSLPSPSGLPYQVAVAGYQCMSKVAEATRELISKTTKEAQRQKDRAESRRQSSSIVLCVCVPAEAPLPPPQHEAQEETVEERRRNDGCRQFCCAGVSWEATEKQHYL